MTQFLDENYLHKFEACQEARRLTEETRRKHVVRNDYGRLFIAPLYELGREGQKADAGYEALGALVDESLG